MIVTELHNNESSVNAEFIINFVERNVKEEGFFVTAEHYNLVTIFAEGICNNDEIVIYRVYQC